MPGSATKLGPFRMGQGTRLEPIERTNERGCLKCSASGSISIALMAFDIRYVMTSLFEQSSARLQAFSGSRLIARSRPLCNGDWRLCGCSGTDGMRPEMLGSCFVEHLIALTPIATWFSVLCCVYHDGSAIFRKFPRAGSCSRLAKTRDFRRRSLLFLKRSSARLP